MVTVMFHNIKSREEGRSRIDVIMADGSHHKVTPRVLEILLDNNRVIKSKRSGGWVSVDFGLLRAKSKKNYCPLYYGPDRRASSEQLTSAKGDS
jgi:hypothetical protein